jgi:outer membrane autotransporter protein
LSAAAFLLLAASVCPADIIYSTGSTLNPPSGETVLITGPANVEDIKLSDSLTLRVSDAAEVNGNLSLNGKTNITFKPASATDNGQWAVMEYKGTGNRLFGIAGAAGSVESGTQTLTFNNVVLKGGKINNAGGALLMNGGDLQANELVIKGNVAFVDNTIKDNNGGAIYAVGSLTFTGTALFAGNKNSWDWDNEIFAHGRQGGAIAFAQASAVGQKLRFEETAMFISNTSGAAGGAIAVSGNDSGVDIVFESFALFHDNTAGASGTLSAGGAISLTGSSSLTFQGGVEMKGNSANQDAGAVLLRGAGLSFEITGGGYLFSENHAYRHGGAILVHGDGGDIKIDGSGTFYGNVAETGAGGAISSPHDVFIGSGAVFENNKSYNGGGAISMSGAVNTLTLSAQTADILFKGNLSGTSPATLIPLAIYFGASSGTLVFDAAAGRKISMEDAIGGGGTSYTHIIKEGAGEVVFSSTRTSNMPARTEVREGALVLLNGGGFGNSNTNPDIVFILASGGTLAGNGNVSTGSAVLQSGATLEVRDGGYLRFRSDNPHTPGDGLLFAGSGTIRIDPTGANTPLNVAKIRVGESVGSAQAQTLALPNNNITLADGAVLQFDLATDDTSDTLSIYNLAFAGGAVIDLTWVESGSFNLLTWSNGTTLSNTDNLTLKFNGEAPTARNAPMLGLATSRSLFLTNTLFSLGLQWTGADPARVWKSSPIAEGNWGDNDGTGEKYFVNGDSVTFGAAGQGTVNLDGIVIASEMNATGGDYTFSGTGGIITSATSVREAAAITGSGTSGKLVKTGAGVLAFANSGSNLFEGGIEIGGGAIAWQNAAQLGLGAGLAIEFTGSGTLRADAASGTATGTLATGVSIAAGKTATLDTQAFAVAYAGVLSGATDTSFLKAGTGTLALAGDSSAFSGTTRVDTGALLLAPSGLLGGVALVKNGATLGGSGSAAVVTTEAGAVLQAGTPGVAATLKVGALNLAAGSTVKFALVTGGSTADLSQNSKLEAGTITLLAGAGDMDAYTLNLSSVLPGVYDLGSGTTLAGARVTQGNNIELTERQFAFFDTATQPGHLLLTLEQTDNALMVWTGQDGMAWATGKNWIDPTDERAFAFIDGDAVFFQPDNQVSAPLAIDVNSTVTASDLRVDGTAALRFHGVGGITTNPAIGTLSGGEGIDGKLKKSGAGVLSFENTGANLFLGGIDIGGGVVEFTNGGQLATGPDSGIHFSESATLRPVADATPGAGRYTFAAAPHAADTVVSATLGGKLNIAGGKRAVFDVPGAADTLVWTGTFDAATSGTLAKTGGGALVLTGDSRNPYGALEVAEGGLFLGDADAKVGGVISVAPGATFGGVGNPTRGVVIAGGATLRVGLAGVSGTTLAVPHLVLQDGALLAGEGILLGTGTLLGRAEADIAAGARLLIASELAGTGTLAKWGEGELVYSTSKPFGHAATEINAGLVSLLTGDDDPAAVTHAFILNGGWLDLSRTTYASDGSTANDWAGLSFSGSLGAVIGSNDRITLGDGTYRFQIGGTTTDTRGVFVVVDAGSGTAVLTGANSYVGLTRLQSGVLAVSEDAQLGDTGLARPVIFEGGALLVTEGFTTKRAMEVAGSGTLLVAAGKTSTWAGSTGDGALTKAGPGTLVVSAPLANGDGVTVAGGVLRGSPANLSGWINNQATVEIATPAATASTLAGIIDGRLGAVVVTGGGTLALDGSKILSASSLGVREGTLVLTGNVPFTLENRFEIGNPSGVLTNATLLIPSGATINAPLFSNKGTVRVGKAAGGTEFATLEINGDYTGYGKIQLNVLTNGKAQNLIVDADRVRVSGSATGETYVVLNLAATGTAAGEPDAGGTEMLQFIEVAGGVDSKHTFQLATRYPNGPYEILLASDGSLSTSVISPELPLVLGTDVASILVGKAALDSLAGRLALTRITEGPRAWDFWINGLYRYDRLTSDDYDGSTIRTQGVQTGVDKHWGRDTWGLTAGLFYDYASADMRVADVNKSSTETIANGAGAYLSYACKSLYVDTVFRAAREDYTITVPGTPSFDTEGSSRAVAVELGYVNKMRGGEVIVPYAGIRWQAHDIDDVTDSFGRTYRFSNAESLEGRAGVRMWDQFDLGRKLTLLPHFGIAVINEFRGDSAVTVDTSRVNITHEFRDNRIRGAGGVLEAGATLQWGARCAFNLEGAWLIAEKNENATVNLGFRYFW